MQPTTLEQFEQMCRQALLQPDAQSPNRLQFLHAANANAQLMFLEMANTHISWSVAEYPFTVTGYQQDYIITAPDFGKAVSIYTADPTNPYHIAREVKIVNLAEINLYYSGATTVGGSGHSAVCFSIMYKQGTPYLRVTPMPSDGQQYVMMYETDSGAFDALSANFHSPAFIHLLRYKTCIELLPYCKWANLPDAEAMVRARSLMEMFLKKEAEYQKQWDFYTSTLTDTGSFYRQGYGDNGDEGGW